jgi:DNA-binding MarR family transcriptional regulator
VLRILRGAGSSGLATLAIADRMADRAPGVTRLLDRLEKGQLVQRTRGEDRRQVLCTIAPAGLELLNSLDERIAGVEEAVFRGLTHNEVGALAHLLERVGAGLR